MTGLIILLILIPLAFFVLLITILNRTSEQQKLTEALYDRLKQLSGEFSHLAKEIGRLKLQSRERTDEAEEKPIQEPTPTPPVITSIKEEKTEPVRPVFTIEKVQPETDRPVFELKEEVDANDSNPPQIVNPALKPATDIEKFIGENLANKIGIAVLVLGISFFVKYAIDKNWIKESGRILIGLIAGAVLIGIAHRIRNSYRSFSSVLVGGGLTVFYFTIAFAFHPYHLISQQTAFIIMVLITAFAVSVALYYNRLELAILATIGGFITPFLVRGEQENYAALFTYLCILNAGLMTLAWFRRWPSINMIALSFTALIYGNWLIEKLWVDYKITFPYKSAMFFGTLFYLQFVIMNIVNNIRQKKSFAAFDFIVVLSINFLFYIAGIFILKYWNGGEYKGLFTSLLGVFNLLLITGFKHKKTIDRNFISLLTGLAITFISLTAPVQFKGSHITLFWSAEMVILYWLFQRARIVQLKIASLVIGVLVVISLLLTWLQVYFSGSHVIPVFLNKGFTTTIASAASWFIYYRFMYKEADTFYLDGYTNRAVRNCLLGAFIITLYFSGALEIYYQFSTRFSIESLFSIYLQLYSFAFAIVLLTVFRKTAVFPVLKLLFTLLCSGLYIISVSINHEISLTLIKRNEDPLFLAHWISIALLLWLLQNLVVYFKRINGTGWVNYLSVITWGSSLGIVFILSNEMYQLNLWINYRGSEWGWWENLYYKAGLSILWGICSFAIMWLGMRFRFRLLRIISLSLFTLTILKLFTYDISNIPPGGKIAAFILLGILLLSVSFMYQRLKKIIIDDNSKTGTAG